MRIALYHHLPPGGALRVVRDFLTRVPDDVQVDVFGLDDGRGSPFPRARTLTPGGHAPLLEPLNPGWAGNVLGGRLASTVMATKLARAEQKVAERINRGGYDVAYVHPCWMSNAPGFVGDLQIPSVLYLQEVRRATFEPSYRHRPDLGVRGLPGYVVTAVTEKALARRDREGVAAATVVACNSLYSSERIMASYGSTATVIALGVDDIVFRRRRSSEPGRLNVIAVGGFEPFKNQLMVVQAVGRIEKSLRPSVTLVYERCDPVYRQAVLAESARLQVQVEEHRQISDEELASLYSSAAATVLAAQLEPFGLTALESIACGTPVVAVREAGYRETVIDGKNGTLVPRSLDALANAIQMVATGRAGLNHAADLPATILPFWSASASVLRQLALLRETAAGPLANPPGTSTAKT